MQLQPLLQYLPTYFSSYAKSRSPVLRHGLYSGAQRNGVTSARQTFRVHGSREVTTFIRHRGLCRHDCRGEGVMYQPNSGIVAGSTSKTPDFRLRRFGFESLLGQCLTWLRPFLVFLSSSRSVVFTFFCSRTPRYNLSSTLYPQSCWCIIQLIHSL
jgi:hypothetical protein